MTRATIAGILPEPVSFTVDASCWLANVESDVHRDLLAEVCRAMEAAAIEAAESYSTAA